MAVTGIVVALPEELRTLSKLKLAPRQIGQIGENALVILSGAGQENAWNAAEILLQQGATRLMSWGCAAAISSELTPGNLVLTDTCIGADGDYLQDSSGWLAAVEAQLASTLKTHRGKLAESLQVIATVEDKQKVNKITGAIALDMESAAIARVAKANKTPFLIIRAIADPVTMNLPNAISHALDHQGVVNLPRLLTYLLRHPGELPGLIRLGLYFRRAQQTLQLVSQQLFNQANQPDDFKMAS